MSESAPIGRLAEAVQDRTRTLEGGGLPLSEESEGVEQLAKAMAAFQAEVKNPPLNGRNPHYGSRYALLQDIEATVRPILGKHGLSFSQRANPRRAQDGRPVLRIVTTVRHSSGQWERAYGEYVIDGKGIASQLIAASTTYAKRNELCAILGVAGGDDTDGEHERDEPEKPRSKATGRPKQVAPQAPPMDMREPVSPPGATQHVDQVKARTEEQNDQLNRMLRVLRMPSQEVKSLIYKVCEVEPKDLDFEGANAVLTNLSELYRRRFNEEPDEGNIIARLRAQNGANGHG